MSAIEFPKLMEVNFSHRRNAYSPMDVNEFGNVTDEKLQLVKAYSSMFFIELERVMEVKEMQS
jgi:hypothetical protein